MVRWSDIPIKIILVENIPYGTKWDKSNLLRVKSAEKLRWHYFIYRSFLTNRKNKLNKGFVQLMLNTHLCLCPEDIFYFWKKFFSCLRYCHAKIYITNQFATIVISKKLCCHIIDNCSLFVLNAIIRHICFVFYLFTN